MIEPVASALEATRTARDRDATILAKRAIAEFRQVLEIEIYVVDDVKVEMAVVVVIAERRAGSPAAFVADTGFLGDVCESSVAIVAVEHATVEIGHVNIFPAIVVIIAHGHPESPTTRVEPDLSSYVFESSVVVVAVELAAVALSRLQIFQSRAVHE